MFFFAALSRPFVCSVGLRRYVPKLWIAVPNNGGSGEKSRLVASGPSGVGGGKEELYLFFFFFSFFVPFVPSLSLSLLSPPFVRELEAEEEGNSF